jgi:DNA (cytosine-5)-methyltransferase 1
MTSVLSLCSGYSGIELGLGMLFDIDLVAYAEIDKWAALLMATHHPDVPNLGDIKTADWSGLAPIEILTAGYPCQPFSHAGKRRGSDDPRHLWPYVCEAIRIIRPRYVFLENVRGHVKLGLKEVIAGLASVGYLGSWCCLRASDVGAPHKRDRVFILARDARSCAATDASRSGAGRLGGAVPRTPGDTRWPGIDLHPAVDAGEPAADTDGEGLAGHGGQRGLGGAARQGAPGSGRDVPADTDIELLDGTDTSGGAGAGGGGEPPGSGWGPYAAAIERWEAILGRPAPQPTVRRISDGSAGGMGDKPLLSRTQQLKALGNGVVPLQAAYAFSLLFDRLPVHIREGASCGTRTAGRDQDDPGVAVER